MYGGREYTGIHDNLEVQTISSLSLPRTQEQTILKSCPHHIQTIFFDILHMHKKAKNTSLSIAPVYCQNSLWVNRNHQNKWTYI